MKKRTNKLSSLVFYALIAMIVLLAITNYLTTGLYARYLSYGAASDEARVAVWDINFDNGGELNTTIPNNHLSAGDKGSYGIDIVNNSETLAKISKDSKVKFRYSSANFNLSSTDKSWNFIKDASNTTVENPINFKVYFYTCSWKDLNEKYLTNGTFNAGTSGVNEYLVLDTNNKTNPLVFEMYIENNSVYYEAVVDFKSVVEYVTEYQLNYDGRACLRITWDVKNHEGSSGGVDSSFVSYHIIKKSEYDVNKYEGIISKSNLGNKELTIDKVTKKKITNTNDTAFNNENYLIKVNNENYVIAYKTYDYFGYLIYTSSLGGEVMITYDNKEDLGIYVKRCTRLTSEELNELNGRTLQNSYADVDAFNRFVEKLEYLSYQEYLKVNVQYEKTKGYLGLGLECSIILNIKVEQVD